MTFIVCFIDLDKDWINSTWKIVYIKSTLVTITFYYLRAIFIYETVIQHFYQFYRRHTHECRRIWVRPDKRSIWLSPSYWAVSAANRPIDRSRFCNSRCRTWHWNSWSVRRTAPCNKWYSRDYPTSRCALNRHRSDHHARAIRSSSSRRDRGVRLPAANSYRPLLLLLFPFRFSVNSFAFSLNALVTFHFAGTAASSGRPVTIQFQI